MAIQNLSNITSSCTDNFYSLFQSLPFINQDIQRIAKEIIDNVIGINQFQAIKVTEWSKSIVNQLLEHLTQKNNLCKYIGNKMFLF